MRKWNILIIVYILIFSGCTYAPPPPVKVSVSKTKVDYLHDVKPILDKRCVVCHSCYNSPCQAKFSSFDGIDRGGSKSEVYASFRFRQQDPSRLFVDAKSTDEWRKKKFFSLTDSTAPKGYNNSLMAQLLEEKKLHPEIIGKYSPETDKRTCSKNLEELAQYQDEHPNHGMPYGYPELNKEEYNTILQWLAQGANGPNVRQQKELETSSVAAHIEIKNWEKFLNKKDAKHQMTSRYFYEHFFLAHIMFEAAPNEYFHLVRSTTPPGEEINVIATRRPYDDPKVDKFYYRLEKIYSTIVHKTHIVVTIKKDDLQRAKKLFIDTKWVQKPYVVGFKDSKLNADPFLVYQQIPVQVRYQHMLNFNEYYIRTFIRGPVCKGQIALDVIRDHFWVIFQDPKADISIKDPDFLNRNTYNLRLPTEMGSDESLLHIFSDKYRDRYTSYYQDKLKSYKKMFPQGMKIDSIWKGNGKDSAPILTVMRHFDSASVRKGTLGNLPKSIWMIDYAQFERIYYALVAGFDVFGNTAHQTNIRRYMDFLRLEGEVNFISLMPPNKRKDIFSSWYLGDAAQVDKSVKNIRKFMRVIPSHILYKTNKPKQELIEKLVYNHFDKKADIHFDKINYVHMGDEIPNFPSSYTTEADIFQAYSALSVPGIGFVHHVIDGGMNVAFVRIRMKNGNVYLSTMIINRWHSNVNSLFNEEDRLDPSKDRLNFIPGSIGSYPNIFFDVKEEDLADFFDMLQNFDDKKYDYVTKFKKYGISRKDKDFWKEYDWFQKKYNEEEPIQSGLYDLNRYYPNP